jgi:hypothetical protein
VAFLPSYASFGLFCGFMLISSLHPSILLVTTKPVFSLVVAALALKHKP